MKQEYLFLQALFQIHLLRIYLYIMVRKLHLLSLNMILRTERLSVIASSLLLQLRRQPAEAVLSKIKEGDTIEGTVKNVTDFGASLT